MHTKIWILEIHSKPPTHSPPPPFDAACDEEEAFIKALVYFYEISMHVYLLVLYIYS